jgi:NAD(P)-dependent dehydrogenase (short-subunit alcohol dehydrogenase family)
MEQNAVPDLIGKTILVTGATSGIGLEAAIVFAAAGAHTIIVGRNPAKADAVLAQIKQRSGSANVEVLLCDFSSQDAIRRLATEFRSRYRRLDVLVNNAGTVHARRRLTADGIEATFAVNHLGYFLLTNLLRDLIVASAPARIVNVASTAHYRGTLDFDDLGFEHGYAIMKAYARSKLANVLFTRELAKRLTGTGVTANAVHPGVVATHIWNGAPIWTRPFFAFAKRAFMISPAQGAATIVYLATHPDMANVNGRYFEKNRPRAPSKPARNNELAARLWAESARLTGIADEN